MSEIIKRTEAERRELIRRMVAALKPLSNELLWSGTARWGAYEKARMVNFRDRAAIDRNRINANVEGIVHTDLDREAANLETERRSWAAVVRAWDGH